MKPTNPAKPAQPAEPAHRVHEELSYQDLSTLMKSSAGITADATKLAGSPDTPFAEYGLDSLGLLGIVGELENRHGVAISGDADSCKTPRAFLDVVNASLTAGV